VNLAAIGLDVEIQSFPRAIQFTKTGTRGEPFDITLEGWHIDYYDPYEFLFQFDGNTDMDVDGAQSVDARLTRKRVRLGEPTVVVRVVEVREVEVVCRPNRGWRHPAGRSSRTSSAPTTCSRDARPSSAGWKPRGTPGRGDPLLRSQPRPPALRLDAAVRARTAVSPSAGAPVASRYPTAAATNTLAC